MQRLTVEGYEQLVAVTICGERNWVNRKEIYSSSHLFWLCFFHILSIKKLIIIHSILIKCTYILKHPIYQSILSPWLVWLSGLSAGLRIKGSPVRFPVRAHAWVVGQVPSMGCMRGNYTLMFLSLSFSLPSPF